MEIPVKLCQAVVVMSAVGVCAACHAQEWVEISEDGHSVRTGRPAQVQAFGRAMRGSGVPFPLTPDLTLELRRQVGGLKVADMNGDGSNDIVVGCYISNSFPPYEDWHDFILYNDYANEASDLGAWPVWLSNNETHTGDVQVGEIDGSPGLELVTMHGSLSAQSVRIFTGAPGGPATSAAFTSATPQSVWSTSGLLVDIDNDTDLDLVTTNQGVFPDSFRPMYQFENVGGVMNPVPVWESAEQSIQGGLGAGDMNNDGFPEIGVAKWVNFQSAMYWNNAGTLETMPFATVASTDGQRSAAMADFDLDGVPELAVGSDPVELYKFDGSSLITLWNGNPPFHSAAQDMVAHDVDGDGDDDLCEIIFSDGRAHIYENNAGVLDTAATWTFDASEVGTAIAFGDINGDGLDDLVTGYSGDTCIRVFLADPPPCPADLAPPVGVLDFSDVVAFLSAFAAMDAIADIAPPFGVFDFSDVAAFLGAFGAGCP